MTDIELLELADRELDQVEEKFRSGLVEVREVIAARNAVGVAWLKCRAGRI